MKKFTSIFSLYLIIVCSSNVSAQTTYKSDSGFYTSVVKSLYLRGGSFEDTQLIGPAVGYRFNEKYDLSLHTEFLFSEIKFNNANNRELSLLNLGVILGRTTSLSEQFLLRSEASMYKSFNFNVNGFSDLPNPSLISGLVSSSLYRRLPLFGSFSFLPNIGAFAGYGDYTPTYTSTNLRQGFDGFVVGPTFGFDASFRLSHSFYLIATPEYYIRYNTTNKNSVGTLLFNVQLNF
ncbi:MAG TPA: hypothetical protein VK074_07240 [Fodinibius sp.]|nr:hypothetical protein [Fodinibius sp.]